MTPANSIRKIFDNFIEELKEHTSALKNMIENLNVSTKAKESLNLEVKEIIQIVNNVDPAQTSPAKEFKVKVFSPAGQKLSFFNVDAKPDMIEILSVNTCTKATLKISSKNFFIKKTIHLPGDHIKSKVEFIDNQGQKLPTK